MNKNVLVLGLGLVAVVVVVGGYLGRHRIKAMLMGPPPAPVAMTPTDTAAPATSPAMTTVSNNLLMTSSTGHLTDPKGLSLYVFDKDTANSGASACSGNCSQAWPAYTTKTNTGLPTDVTAFQRTDDKMWQLAYKGWPLYHYASDVKAGDTTGDGVGGVWHLAKP